MWRFSLGAPQLHASEDKAFYLGDLEKGMHEQSVPSRIVKRSICIWSRRFVVETDGIRVATANKRSSQYPTISPQISVRKELDFFVYDRNRRGVEVCNSTRVTWIERVTRLVMVM